MSDHTNLTANRGTSAKVVAGSLFAGAASAAAFVAGPFAGGGEATITGAILLGFAIGWALLALLSARRGDGSHRWAAVPATVLGVSGAALVTFTPSSETLDALGWVWPPALLGLVVWMAARTRRQPARRGGSWPLYPVFALMAISAVGGSYETIRASSSGGPTSVTGNRLVDVGGHRLNIRCIGSGSPTVVLEPGLGEPASEMAERIAPQLARTTRVCVYDRAGHGRSDVAPGADAARDLHVLLADMSPLLAVVPTLARTGIARLLLDPKDGEPVEQLRQFVRDVEQMPAQLNRAAQLETLGDLPLAVVSAATGSQPGWAREQANLAALSNRSTHRTVAGSTHGSLVLDSQDAMASSRAIEDVVREVRHAADRRP